MIAGYETRQGTHRHTTRAARVRQWRQGVCESTGRAARSGTVEAAVSPTQRAADTPEVDVSATGPLVPEHEPSTDEAAGPSQYPS